MTFSIKKVNKCVDCKKGLRKNHRHHFRCNDCWFEYNCKKQTGLFQNQGLRGLKI